MYFHRLKPPMTAILAFENSGMVFRIPMTALAAASNSSNECEDITGRAKPGWVGIEVFDIYVRQK